MWVLVVLFALWQATQSLIRRPESSSFALTIAKDFDETRSYRIKLYEIEERESQFGKGNFLFWKANVYREDGTVFEDTRDDVEVFDLWFSTSDSTFANPNTGQRAKARQYAEAFMGRELTDEEVNDMIDQGFDKSLVGKIAIGSFEITHDEKGDRIQVVKLRPVRAPMPQQQAVAAARSTRLDD